MKSFSLYIRRTHNSSTHKSWNEAGSTHKVKKRQTDGQLDEGEHQPNRWKHQVVLVVCSRGRNIRSCRRGGYHSNIGLL